MLLLRFVATRPIGARRGEIERGAEMKESDISRIEITDLSKALRAIEEAQEKFGGTLLWRGHADESWKIQAEVFRLRRDGENYNEISLINHFRAQAEARYSKCPQFDDISGWLILARHYGLPTRILDWTINPLVAIYFAVYDNIEYKKDGDRKDGCLWAIDTGLLNYHAIKSHKIKKEVKIGLFPLDSPRVKSVLAQAFNKTKKSDELPKVLACGTRHVDSRVLAQQGSFTIHADGTDLADIPYVKPEGGPEPKAWRRMFRIPKDAKNKIWRELDGLGIRKSTLFPDLGALAEDLKLFRMKSNASPSP